MEINFNKFKLNETPDFLIIDDGKIDSISYNEYGAYPFGYYESDLVIGYEGDTHKDIEYMNDSGFLDTVEDRSSLYCPGRLWTEKKIISFWQYPETKEEMENLIEDINNIAEKKDIEISIDDSWQVEIRNFDNDEFNRRVNYIFDNTKDKLSYIDVSRRVHKQQYVLISITDYIGPMDSNEVDQSPHLLPPEKKKKVLMKNGYRAKETKWKKYMKPFESFDSKQNEDADTLYLDDKTIFPRTVGVFPFAYNYFEGDEEFYFGKEATLHQDNIIVDNKAVYMHEDDQSYSDRTFNSLDHVGRLWKIEELDKYIISMYYPVTEQYEFRYLIENILKTFDDIEESDLVFELSVNDNRRNIYMSVEAYSDEKIR